MQQTRARGRSTASYLRLMLIITLCFAISCIITLTCINSAGQNIAKLNSDWFTMTGELDQLKSRLDYVRSDAYVERVARDEFGLIKPGEIRYVTQ